MDPSVLAGAAVGLLVKLFGAAGEASAGQLAERLTDAASERARALYQCIKARFEADPYDEALLTGIQAAPDDAARQTNLRNALEAAIERDDGFGAAIGELVESARASGAPVVLAQNSAFTAGRDVSVTAGGDVVGRDAIRDDARPRT